MKVSFRREKTSFPNRKGILAIRKITILFLLTACLCASTTTAQKITYSGTNVSLQMVFDTIRQQTGYGVFIEDALLSQTKNVTVHLKDVSIQEALITCFKSQPVLLDFYIAGRSIIVKKKAPQKELKSADIGNTSADPPFEIHGHVTDSLENPLSGVSVTAKGNKASAVTDQNGYFTLSGINPKATILFSSIGYETVQYKINGKNDISIQLKVSIRLLRNVEIVYSNGYQSLNKERFVGSVTKIDSSLFQREVSTDVLSRLDGISNSLLFDKRSAGSGSVRLQVRGVSSINSNLNPLIILDNFPYTGDINIINPNDIEDITILKDAAAASIWGTQAGNGVIIITTKKGRYNQAPRISINSNISIQKKPDLFYFPQISSSDFIDIEKNLFNQGFYDGDLSDTYSWPVISPVVEILNDQKNGLISSSEADTKINALKGQDIRNDYKKYILRNAVNQQNHISISGGSSTVNYMVSFGYDNNTSSIKGPGGYNRYTVISNTSFKPFKFLELSAGFNFSQNKTNFDGLNYTLVPGGAGYNKSQIYPYAQILDASGDHLAVPYGYRLGYIDTAGGGKLLDWHYRPLDEMRQSNYFTRTQYYLANIRASINFTPWLNGEIKYQYSQQPGLSRNLQSQQSFYTRNLINLYTQSDGTNTTNIIPLGSILDITHNEMTIQNLRGQLNFSKKWGDKNDLTALIAGELNTTKSNSDQTRLYGYNDDILTYATTLDYATYYPLYVPGYGSAQIFNNTLLTSGTLSHLASFLSNASYTYDNRYTLYASAREDGANTFGVKTNNKWKPLWSAGASWAVSNEAFYHVNWLNTLRLRASFGYMGNTNNSISGLPTITFTNNNPYTNTPIAFPNAAPNPLLRWEQVRTINLGVDFSVLNKRISGTLEWFNKRSTDLIAPALLDPTIGVLTYNINLASLKGNGIDFSLQTKNILGAFKWETDFQFNHVKTIITKYYINNYASSNFIGAAPAISPFIGRFAYPMFSYKWAGLDPVTGDPQGYLNGHISKDYIGIGNDSIQNQVYNGSAFPLYFGNLLNRFSWRSLSLSVNIIYKFDYYFRKPAINYTGLYNNWYLPGSNDYKDRWQKAGDEKITDIPSAIYPPSSDRDAFYGYSEVNVEKADNIRLQDIRLSYNWINKNKSRLPIQNVQVYLYAGNLNIMLWKASKSSFDPDYATSVLPSLRNLSLGLNVNF